MHPETLRIEDYTYNLPDDRIARYPLQERDASQLLVYNGGNITTNSFTSLPGLLPENTMLVYNQTKVVNARLLFKKPSGGVIEVFCLEPHKQYPDITSAMMQQGKVWWHCLVGGASKWKPGMILELQAAEAGFTLSACIVERTATDFIIELSWDKQGLTFSEVLKETGSIPLPPYLNRSAETSDNTRYQTLFAKTEGSVAAPTASLHFTPAVLDALTAKGISSTLLTLHVGAGTFKPVKSETIGGHTMHEEWLEVTEDSLAALIDHYPDGPIVAVGTTALRTLESLYWMGLKVMSNRSLTMQELAVKQWEPYEQTADTSTRDALLALRAWMHANTLTTIVTKTQILIAPGYTFRVISGLVTNFHQPQSTLLLLVAALVGADWKHIYEFALTNNYRFLSYGDSSLLWAGSNTFTTFDKQS